jgi:hypothetical protein
MRNAAALQMGLALVQRPQSVGSFKALPLPEGVTFLLEVAVGDVDALTEAQLATGQSEEQLRAAAGFFIEQLLLSRKTDSYGCLGTRSSAPTSELRRNMSLLMKWLHPDVTSGNALATNLDRSVFATRVTQAWDNLKTDDRRAAYDVEQSRTRAYALSQTKRRKFHLGAKSDAKKTTGKISDATVLTSRPGSGAVKRPVRVRKPTSIGMFRLVDDGLLSRLMMFLRGRP